MIRAEQSGRSIRIQHTLRFEEGQRAMKKNGGNSLDRREMLKASAMALGGSLLAGEATEVFSKSVNTNSSPSNLKITDLRVATLVKPGPSPCPIIRIDTNQGVYGLGEVRDGASPTYALFLKSRLLGEDPLKTRQNLPQDQTVWWTRPPGRWRLCHRNGALGHRRKSLQRARLRFARRRQISRQDPACTRTPRSPMIPRFTRSA